MLTSLQKPTMQLIFKACDCDSRSKGLMSLKNDKTTCDVVFQAGNEETGIEEISGHSALFAAQSDVLKSLLYGPMYESQNRQKNGNSKSPHVVIEDISPKVFKKFQDYVYGMDIRVWLSSLSLQLKKFHQNMICQLFYFSNKYLIHGMTQLLVYHVSAEFAWDVLYKKIRGCENDNKIKTSKQSLMEKFFCLLNQLFEMKLFVIIPAIMYEIYHANQIIQIRRVNVTNKRPKWENIKTFIVTHNHKIAKCILLSHYLHILHPKIVQLFLFNIQIYIQSVCYHSKVNVYGPILCFIVKHIVVILTPKT